MFNSANGLEIVEKHFLDHWNSIETENAESFDLKSELPQLVLTNCHSKCSCSNRETKLIDLRIIQAQIGTWRLEKMPCALIILKQEGSICAFTESVVMQTNRRLRQTFFSL